MRVGSDEQSLTPFKRCSLLVVDFDISIDGFPDLARWNKACSSKGAATQDAKSNLHLAEPGSVDRCVVEMNILVCRESQLFSLGLQVLRLSRITWISWWGSRPTTLFTKCPREHSRPSLVHCPGVPHHQPHIPELRPRAERNPGRHMEFLVRTWDESAVDHCQGRAHS